MNNYSSSGVSYPFVFLSVTLNTDSLVPVLLSIDCSISDFTRVTKSCGRTLCVKKFSFMDKSYQIFQHLILITFTIALVLLLYINYS